MKRSVPSSSSPSSSSSSPSSSPSPRFSSSSSSSSSPSLSPPPPRSTSISTSSFLSPSSSPSPSHSSDFSNSNSLDVSIHSTSSSSSSSTSSINKKMKLLSSPSSSSPSPSFPLSDVLRSLRQKDFPSNLYNNKLIRLEGRRGEKIQMEPKTVFSEKNHFFEQKKNDNEGGGWSHNNPSNGRNPNNRMTDYDDDHHVHHHSSPSSDPSATTDFCPDGENTFVESELSPNIISEQKEELSYLHQMKSKGKQTLRWETVPMCREQPSSSSSFSSSPPFSSLFPPSSSSSSHSLCSTEYRERFQNYSYQISNSKQFSNLPSISFESLYREPTSCRDKQYEDYTQGIIDEFRYPNLLSSHFQNTFSLKKAFRNNNVIHCIKAKRMIKKGEWLGILWGNYDELDDNLEINYEQEVAILRSHLSSILNNGEIEHDRTIPNLTFSFCYDAQVPCLPFSAVRCPSEGGSSDNESCGVSDECSNCELDLFYDKKTRWPVLMVRSHKEIRKGDEILLTNQIGFWEDLTTFRLVFEAIPSHLVHCWYSQMWRIVCEDLPKVHGDTAIDSWVEFEKTIHSMNPQLSSSSSPPWEMKYLPSTYQSMSTLMKRALDMKKSFITEMKKKKAKKYKNHPGGGRNQNQWKGDDSTILSKSVNDIINNDTIDEVINDIQNPYIQKDSQCNSLFSPSDYPDIFSSVGCQYGTKMRFHSSMSKDQRDDLLKAGYHITTQNSKYLHKSIQILEGGKRSKGLKSFEQIEEILGKGNSDNIRLCELKSINNMVRLLTIPARPAYGVVANRNLPKGSLLCNYVSNYTLQCHNNGSYCYLMPTGLQLNRYLPSHSTLLGDNNPVMDAFEYGNIGRMLNDIKWRPAESIVDGISQNVKEASIWSRKERLPHLLFAAKRPIREGEECIIDYGHLYWQSVNPSIRKQHASYMKLMMPILSALYHYLLLNNITPPPFPWDLFDFNNGQFAHLPKGKEYPLEVQQITSKAIKEKENQLLPNKHHGFGAKGVVGAVKDQNGNGNFSKTDGRVNGMGNQRIIRGSHEYKHRSQRGGGNPNQNKNINKNNNLDYDDNYGEWKDDEEEDDEDEEEIEEMKEDDDDDENDNNDVDEGDGDDENDDDDDHDDNEDNHPDYNDNGNDNGNGNGDDGSNDHDGRKGKESKPHSHGKDKEKDKGRDNDDDNSNYDEDSDGFILIDEHEKGNENGNQNGNGRNKAQNTHHHQDRQNQKERESKSESSLSVSSHVEVKHPNPSHSLSPPPSPSLSSSSSFSSFSPPLIIPLESDSDREISQHEENMKIIDEWEGGKEENQNSKKKMNISIDEIFHQNDNNNPFLAKKMEMEMKMDTHTRMEDGDNDRRDNIQPISLLTKSSPSSSSSSFSSSSTNPIIIDDHDHQTDNDHDNHNVNDTNGHDDDDDDEDDVIDLTTCLTPSSSRSKSSQHLSSHRKSKEKEKESNPSISIGIPSYPPLSSSPSYPSCSLSDLSTLNVKRHADKVSQWNSQLVNPIQIPSSSPSPSPSLSPSPSHSISVSSPFTSSSADSTLSLSVASSSSSSFPFPTTGSSSVPNVHDISTVCALPPRRSPFDISYFNDQNTLSMNSGNTQNHHKNNSNINIQTNNKNTKSSPSPSVSSLSSPSPSHTHTDISNSVDTPLLPPPPPSFSFNSQTISPNGNMNVQPHQHEGVHLHHQNPTVGVKSKKNKCKAMSSRLSSHSHSHLHPSSPSPSCSPSRYKVLRVLSVPSVHDVNGKYKVQIERECTKEGEKIRKTKEVTRKRLMTMANADEKVAEFDALSSLIEKQKEQNEKRRREMEERIRIEQENTPSHCNAHNTLPFPFPNPNPNHHQHHHIIQQNQERMNHLDQLNNNHQNNPNNNNNNNNNNHGSIQNNPNLQNNPNNHNPIYHHINSLSRSYPHPRYRLM